MMPLDTIQSTITTDNQPTSTPDWLLPKPVTGKQLSTIQKCLEDTYQNFFEIVLEKMCEGSTLEDIINDDNRTPPINSGKFRRWLHKDQERLKQFYDARMIGASVIEDQILSIADGSTNSTNHEDTNSILFDDVARSKLRIDARFKLMEGWDKKRWGKTSQIELTTTHNVNIRALLESRESRIKTIDQSALSPSLLTQPIMEAITHVHDRESVANTDEDAE